MTRTLRMTFIGMGMMRGLTINLTGLFLPTSRYVSESRPSLSLLLLPPLGLASVAHHLSLWEQGMTTFSLRIWFPLFSGQSLPLIGIALLLRTRAQPTICSQTVRPSFHTSQFGIFGFGWATTLTLQSLGGGLPSFPLMASVS